MKKDKWLIAAAGAGVALVAYNLLSKAKSIPERTLAFSPFDMERYLGKWYEIARLPNLIEKGIKDVTEEYILNPNGTLKVITRGFSIRQNEWKEYAGKIKFADNEDIGMLKVSYFGPFYAAYNVLDLDDNYQYALVSTGSLNYLWILSREKNIPDDIKTRFLDKGKRIGFAMDKLEWM